MKSILFSVIITLLVFACVSCVNVVDKEQGNYTYSASSTFCSGCAACIEPCPRNAIVLYSKLLSNGNTVKQAIIDPAKCIGCGQCFVVCRYNAINKELKINR